MGSQQKSKWAGGILYSPCAEWVVKPNGIALKISCKKGLVKWTASLLIIEDSLRKLWQSTSIATTKIRNGSQQSHCWNLLLSNSFDFLLIVKEETASGMRFFLVLYKKCLSVIKMTQGMFPSISFYVHFQFALHIKKKPEWKCQKCKFWNIIKRFLSLVEV